MVEEERDNTQTTLGLDTSETISLITDPSVQIFIIVCIGLLLIPIYAATFGPWFSRVFVHRRMMKGTETTDGQLSDAAKQMVRSYMLSFFAIGGPIIAIISGALGYMINDLAKERAMAAAMREMQRPVVQSIRELEAARGSIAVVESRVSSLQSLIGTDEFFDRVVRSLKDDDRFVGQIIAKITTEAIRPVAERLVERHKADLTPPVQTIAAYLVQNYADDLRGSDGESPSVTAVSNYLVTNHAEDLRGIPGKDGDSTSTADVAAYLVQNYSDDLRGSDGESPSVTAVSNYLVTNHAEVLRGIPGKDGDSTSTADVAAYLVQNYSDDLRGSDGESPSVTAVSNYLVTNHAEDLRGIPGKDGESTSTADVAAYLVQNYSDDLRGSDGESPSVTAVSNYLVTNHAEVLRGRRVKDGESTSLEALAEKLAADHSTIFLRAVIPLLYLMKDTPP